MITIKAPKIIYILLLGAILLPAQLFSQSKYKRKISITEWVEEMERCKEPVYYLENTEIFYDDFKDSIYSFRNFQSLMADTTLTKNKEVYAMVILRNCKLPEVSTCSVSNITFLHNVTFANCEGALQLRIVNCIFEKGLDIRLSNLKDLEFWNCQILQRIVISELEISILVFSKCSFYTDHTIPESPYFFGIEKENQSYQYLFNVRQSEKKINTFILSDCKILPTDVNPVLFFNGGQYDVVDLEETNFANCILNFINCSVKENFTVQNCLFNLPIGMQAFNFPKDNTNFNWSQIDSVGLGLYPSYAQSPYTTKTDSLISDVNIYNDLNSSYRKFYSMYRTQGDMESANACYKQMKDMETGKYHHLYEKNPGIQTWFNWRFNQFLKYFSEYGTNPVKSLIFSMWTILIFAAVYFFFYSDWDGINRTFMIKQHRKLMQYFRSEQRLEDFYVEGYIDDLKTFADYKKEMMERKAEVPMFILLLGKPLYLLSVVRHKILTFIYRRTEILQGRWIDLKPARKVFVGVTVGFSITVYLIFLSLVRALNSTALSINVFSTLGFGAIPVKGVSRYITIIEGFLGWFLLSIFSVSLISQMLQN